MNINRKIVPAGLKNNPNKTMKSISYITIHTTGNTNPNATAKMHADYQFGGSGEREASWHYTVDKDEIWQSFEDISICWHAGDPTGNFSSIGIEICDNDKSKFVQACDNAAHLTAKLLKKYNLPIENVKQHNYWSGKDCPKEIRAGNWGVTWSEFLLKAGKYMDEINNKPSDWCKEEWELGVKLGIVADDNPRGSLTKEQVVAMIIKAKKANL
ncbi:hypothetical protein FACS1894188_08890 [Clostridia bacterium]|nr:hypothetical protein FACS1894188_08890 [Clostridia bacterium]